MKVSGTVLLDGEPLADAQLVFWPVNDLNLGSFGGKTDTQGRFDIKMDGRHGAAKPGRYVVLVTKGEGVIGPGEGVALPQQAATQRGAGANPAALPNPNPLPKKYGDKQKSPFVFDIAKGSNELPALELVSR
jgi:hypothetical protein